MLINACQDLRGYFHDRLRSAQARTSHQTDQETEFYLVEMLTRFGRSEWSEASDKPFIYELAKAGNARDPRERLRRYRELGDVTLFVCGFFPESLEHRGISRGYVSGLGRRAYRSAGRLVGEPRRRVFRALGHEFSAVTKVLEQVREAPIPQSAEEILKAYQAWRQHGDERIAAALRAAGVTLPTQLDS